MSDPIITVTEYPHLGKHATLRPVRQNEVIIEYASLRAHNDTRLELVVNIPGHRDIALGYNVNDDNLIVEVPMDEAVKGTTNRKAREQHAIATALGLDPAVVGGSMRGFPVVSVKAVAAINKRLALNVEAFNERFERKAAEMVQRADSLFEVAESKDEQYAALKGRVLALQEVRTEVTNRLRAAHDELHAAARDKMIDYFETIKAPVSRAVLSKVERERSIFL